MPEPANENRRVKQTDAGTLFHSSSQVPFKGVLKILQQPVRSLEEPLTCIENLEALQHLLANAFDDIKMVIQKLFKRAIRGWLDSHHHACD